MTKQQHQTESLVVEVTETKHDESSMKLGSARLYDLVPESGSTPTPSIAQETSDPAPSLLELLSGCITRVSFQILLILFDYRKKKKTPIRHGVGGHTKFVTRRDQSH